MLVLVKYAYETLEYTQYFFIILHVFYIIPCVFLLLSEYFHFHSSKIQINRLKSNIDRKFSQAFFFFWFHAVQRSTNCNPITLSASNCKDSDITQIYSFSKNKKPEVKRLGDVCINLLCTDRADACTQRGLINFL